MVVTVARFGYMVTFSFVRWAHAHFCKYIQDTIIHNIYEKEDNLMQGFFYSRFNTKFMQKVRFSSIIHIKMKKN